MKRKFEIDATTHGEFYLNLLLGKLRFEIDLSPRHFDFAAFWNYRVFLMVFPANRTRGGAFRIGSLTWKTSARPQQ